MGKACKTIKEAVLLEPRDADNWITWGLIMRKVGNYKISKHKFNQALKLDPDNETAKYELELLDRIIELDS
jgi:Flp pilus assembly protein TadD